MKKKVQIGDIIEIKTNKGLAYAQYVLKKEKWGALIRVLEGLFEKRPPHFSKLVENPERFITFFPLGAAVNRGIFEVVSNRRVPERFESFPIFRASGNVLANKSEDNWWLWDGEKEWFIGNLTDDLKKLPLRQVINDTLLIDRIENNWTPSKNEKS
jgi:hypothetical protein